MRISKTVRLFSQRWLMSGMWSGGGYAEDEIISVHRAHIE
jgi:hypothetical protein